MWTTACYLWMMSSCDDGPSLPAGHKRRIRYCTASEWPCGTTPYRGWRRVRRISIVVACEIRFGLAKNGAHRIVDRLTQVLAQCKTRRWSRP
jgi:hypothetical protein